MRLEPIQKRRTPSLYLLPRIHLRRVRRKSRGRAERADEEAGPAGIGGDAAGREQALDAADVVAQHLNEFDFAARRVAREHAHRVAHAGGHEHEAAVGRDGHVGRLGQPPHALDAIAHDLGKRE